MCGMFDFKCKGGEAIAGGFSKMLNELYEKTVESTGKVVENSITMWAKADTPTVLKYRTGDGGWDSNGTSNMTDKKAPTTPTSSDIVWWIQDHVSWYAVGMMVVSVIILGAKIAMSANGQPANELFKKFFRWVLVLGAGTAIIDGCIVMGDQFASWIVDEGTDGTSLADSIKALFGVDGPAATPSLGIIAGLIGIGFGLLFSMIQYLLMIVRADVLMLVAGVLPLAASVEKWFSKCLGWIFAFLLYKPIAALIVATGIKMSAFSWTGEGSPSGMFQGVVLIGLALLAMPALVAVCAAPAAAVASGGSGFAAGLGGMALAGMGRGGGGSKGVGEMPTGAQPSAKSKATADQGGGPNGAKNTSGGNNGQNAPAEKDKGNPSGSTAVGGQAGAAGKAAGSQAVSGAAGRGAVSVGGSAAAGAASGGATVAVQAGMKAAKGAINNDGKDGE